MQQQHASSIAHLEAKLTLLRRQMHVSRASDGVSIAHQGSISANHSAHSSNLATSAADIRGARKG